MTRPDRRTLQASQTLLNLAPQVGAALGHLERERLICDGYPTKGESAGRGGATSSTTEAAALALQHFTVQADDIRDTITAIENDIRRLSRLTSQSIGMRAPIDVPRCRDNQMGRQGALDWGDALCEELPAKAGLCSAHYQKERRHRLAHGLAPRDIEAAA